MTSRVAVAGILVAACASVTLAQFPQILPVPLPGVRILPQPGPQQQQPDAVDTQAVYVRDSGVASERLQLAERLEKQKEWSKAADVLQDAAQKYGDRVVAVRNDKAGKPVQYVSATQTVQDRLAKWPAEGIAAYRKRFEDTARDALNADTSERTAARVMTLYFLTDAGRDASLSVMATAFERGDFVTAAGVGRRLLDAHPALEAERPKVLLWTGMAEHLAGREKDANARLDELKTRHADAIVSVAGTDAKAVDQLTAALATPAPAAGRYRSDDWPTPYGTPDAAAVPDQICVGGARLFSVALPGPSRRNINAQGLSQYRRLQEMDRKSGMSTGILPVVDGGALYFQDNARVWAVGLSTGLPLPGWAANYPGDKNGAYTIDADPTPRNRQTAVTVSGDSVVALLSQFDLAAGQRIGPSPQPPQIVCLDKLTGRRNWTTSANALKVPDTLVNLREGVFYGTPVVDGDAVYVPLYANRGQQFEECYVVALNLADGNFRWASYVASTSLGNRQLDNVSELNTLTVAAVSLAGGRLYVATNLGAVACLDTADGRTLWLNIYEKSKAQLPNFVGPTRPAGKPFTFGPPIVADGRVFVLPTDSTNVLIYDADNGDTVRTLPRKLQLPKDPEINAIAGVIDNALIVTNRSTIFRIPWRTYDPTKSVVDNGGGSRSIPRAENDNADPPDSIRGRVFVSGKSILVPSAERLYRLSTSTLQIESTYPASGKWDEEESAGNIVATPENLIVAGPTRVTAYTDLNVATAKLEARIGSTPGDIEAYLRYAELLLAAGQPKPGIEKLDQAIAKLGGRDRISPGPMRDRLFEIAIGFAGKLQRTEPKSPTILQLFDRAAVVAATAEQQARYRLGRAAAMRLQGQPDEELALHQQILLDPAWRSASVAGRTGPSTAGAEAELGVNELLRLRGVAIYREYDRTAFEKLDALKKSSTPDIDALFEVASAYPAATSAPEALALAAERMEAAGDVRRASLTLRRLLARDVSNERRQSALQALARAALRSPGQAAIAQVRLRQATAIAPDTKPDKPLVLPNGKVLDAPTLTAAIAQIDAYRTKADDDMLPTLGAPLTTAEGSDFTKPAFRPAEVVAPAVAILQQQEDIARPNRVVIVDVGGKVGVVDATTSAVKWTDAALPPTQIGCGYLGDQLIVVTAGEVSAIDSAGKVKWATRIANLTPIEVAPLPGAEERVVENDVVDMPMRQNIRRVQINRRVRLGRWPGGLQARPPVEDAPPPTSEEFVRFRVLSDRVVLTTTAGRTMAIDTNGETLWQARPSDVTAGRLVSNDDFVAVAHTDPTGATGQVCAFDAQTGQIVHRKGYNVAQGVQNALVNLALSPDGVLVTMLAGRLVAQDLYDPGSGERKYDRPVNGFGEPQFGQSNLDGQLVISGDRVLAVVRSPDANGQGMRQSVRAFDLRTMRPLTMKDPNGRQSEISFSTGSTDAETGLPVTLRPAGRSFYVVGQRSFASYGFAKSEQAWTASNGAGDLGPIRDVIVAKDFVVLVRQVTPVPTSSPRLPAINVSLFNRTWLDDLDRENGSLEQRPTIADPAAIATGEWQAADGAFYYVSGDSQLKVLRANR